MKFALTTIILLTITSCKLQTDKYEDQVEVIEPTEGKPSLSCVIDIEGWKFDSISNAFEIKVSRTVNTKKLKEDSLCYWIDKDDWYSEIPKAEGDIEYYVQMNLKDIDTNEFRIFIKKDVVKVRLVLKENNKIKISKVGWKGAKMTRLWTFEADSIKLDFPTDLERIKREFREYQMFNSTSDCQTDYTNESVLEISGLQITEGVIETIKKEIKNGR